MRLLYIGQLRDGGTCLARMRTLEQMGTEIIGFDVARYANSGTRIERSILHRFHFGQGIAKLNRELSRVAEAAQFDVVWIDKGVFVLPETVRDLREKSKLRLAVHYTPDPQVVAQISRHFLAAIPHYDLLVTTKPYEVAAYKRHGGRNVLTILQGYGPQFVVPHLTDRDQAQFAADVSFIGHCERHYVGRVRAALAATTNVAVRGKGWPKYASRNAWARVVVRGDGVWGSEYPRALASAKIVLGLLTKLWPDETTTRTFEIPAVGAFMLAERTAEHQALFKEGVEAEFFGSDSEMQDKIRYYLENVSARTRIAAAGRERCVKSGYDDRHQLGRVLEALSVLRGAPDVAKRPPLLDGHTLSDAAGQGARGVAARE